MKFFEEFTDHFFFMVSVFCALMVFLDWAIGPAGRSIMRKKVADWWEYLDNESFVELLSLPADIIHDFLTDMFDDRFFSLKRYYRSSLLALLISLFSYTIILFIIPNSPLSEFITFSILSSLSVVFGTWLSLSATIFCLEKMFYADDNLEVAFIIVIDIVIMNVISGISICALMIISLMSNSLSLLIEEAISSDYIIHVLVTMAVVPSLAHLAFTAVILISTALEPVIKPFLSWILCRFHESDKGILTQISIGCGVLAKLGQQALKVYG